MEIYKGTSTFPGIAIGKIRYYHRGEYQLRQYVISNVKKEIAEFHKARLQVFKELKELSDKKAAAGEQEEAGRLLSQAEILESASYQKAVESMISAEKVNAAYAVMTTRDELSETFRTLETPAIRARIESIKAVSVCLIRVLGGVAPKIDIGSEPVILAADGLSPAEIMEMEQDKLLAVVTHLGSEISHAAILAKTMAIPSVFGVEPDDEWNGAMAIVDGYTGTLYLHPDSEVMKEYEIRRQADLREQEALLALKDAKDCTLDGKKVEILANIGSLEDLNSVLYYRASGIGLLRSEFQYLGRDNYPHENELFLAYKKVAETMGERCAVIRTADLGADKQAAYLNIPQETNPIMGNRGIRLCLDRVRMFKAQLRAIYRASAYGNLAVMYPMITSEEEVAELETIVEEVKAGLREKGIPYKDIPVGIMIETPAAVMISRELAKRVDFLGLGTNDLTQYTLAMDRQNPLLRSKYNDHHPAVLRMIKQVIDAGHLENCRVGICGEIAADTKLTETFLRMGVDYLSVVPACILPVRKALRAVDLSK